MFVNFIVKIVNDLYGKFVDLAMDLLICAVKEIIDVLGVGFDGLSRKIVTGDFSDGNLWSCFKLGYFFKDMELFRERRATGFQKCIVCLSLVVS